MDGSTQGTRRLTGTAYFAIAMHALKPDRYQVAFEKDWEFWEEIIRALAVRFLSNSTNSVNLAGLTREVMMSPFLLHNMPEPPEEDLEAHRSHKARVLFYTTFHDIALFAIDRCLTMDRAEIDPSEIPLELSLPFEKAYLHHHTWSTLKNLEQEGMRVMFNELYETYLPAVLSVLHAGEEDVLDFKNLCKDILLVLAERKLSEESIRILSTQYFES